MVDVGTPPHQFPAVLQSVLVSPDQVPVVQGDVATFKMPVVVEPK